MLPLLLVVCFLNCSFYLQAEKNTVSENHIGAPKIQKNMMLLNYDCSNIAIAIFELFSFASCKVIAHNLLCFIYLAKVIALKSKKGRQLLLTQNGE